jgi:Tol biopolymer transport system component
MEYLEGETLADRLEKGALSPDELLKTGIQIADALDKAHRNGVVHRDLKPGNIMITREGVKLLDFGLAKLGDVENQPASGSIPGLSGMATTADEKPLTKEGTIIGTFLYMAPEQLESKEADSRSDIFAFGSVIYEAATGQKAFEGDSQASLIAKIMTQDPRPISELVPMTPPALDRVVKTCMAKDPDRRFQSAHDLKLQLEWILEGGSQAGIPAPVAVKRRRREHVWMAAAAVLLVAAIGFGYLALGTSETQPGTMKLSLAHNAPTSSPQFDSPALSPDGTRIAYAGFDQKDQPVLYLRDLGGLEATIIPGAEGGIRPFWSPDGNHLGFFHDNKLKRVDVSGGPPQVVGPVEGRPTGGTWSEDGNILFGSAYGADYPIARVSATGGDPVAVTAMDSTEVSHLWPSFLPDGKHFIYLGDASSAENHHLKVGSLDGTVDKKISNEISNFQFVPPDLVLYGKSGVLVAQHMDLDGLELAGEPVALARNVVALNGHHYQFTASHNGVLAFRTASSLRQLTWFDRSGRKLETVDEPMRVGYFSLSPDEQRVALTKRDVEDRPEDILMIDLSRNITSRFTLDAGSDAVPIWSPTGDRVFFRSSRTGTWQPYIKPARGPGEPMAWGDSEGFPLDWSPDGNQFLVSIVRGTMANPEGDDGKWLAYESVESGRFEIYVHALGQSGDRLQVSTEGGTRPRWRDDGGEIYYRAPGGFMMAVEVNFDPYLELSSPKSLFVVPEGFENYDVTGDGERFLVAVSMEGLDSKPLTVVLNWTKELEE